MATTQNILIGAQTFDISAHLYAGSGSAANAATTNGNTKLTITNESTVRNNVSVVGTGATSVTSDANGKVTINSTDTTYSFTDGENGFTVTPSSGSAQVVEVIPSLEKSATNSFDDGIDSYFKKVLSTIVPVQAGSGTPSPTNVRAISGFTECTVNDWGTNRFELQFTSQTINGVTFTVENGVIKTQGTANAEIKAFIGITHFDYTGASILSGCPANGSRETYRLISCDIGGGEYYAEWGESREIALTRELARVKIAIASGVNVDGLEFKPMVIPKTEAGASFEPYKSTTATISFGSAGTVYGGYVDLISGKLVVDRGYIEFDGSSDENWINVGGDYPQVFQIDTGITNVLSQDPAYQHLISNRYPQMTTASGDYGTRWQVATANGRLYVYDNNYASNLSGYKTSLGTTHLQLVYELATPQTYQLTPTQLRSLVGTNNLTSNTGEVTEIEYITNETIAYVDDKVEDSTFTFTLTNVPTRTLNTANTDITSYSDKTPSEIKAAYLTGKTICCKISINPTQTYLLYPYFKYDFTAPQGWEYDQLHFGNLDYSLYYKNMIIYVDFVAGAIKSAGWSARYATSSTPGIIYVGQGLTVSDGTVSVKAPTEYTAVTTESQVLDYTYYISSNYQSMKIGLSIDDTRPWYIKKHLYCQIYDSHDFCLICELMIPIGSRINQEQLTDVRCICSGGFSCDNGAITKGWRYFLLDTTKIKRGSDTLAQLMNDVSPDVSFIIYVD